MIYFVYILGGFKKKLLNEIYAFYSGMNENRTHKGHHLFEYLVPTRWNYLRRIRGGSLVGRDNEEQA